MNDQKLIHIGKSLISSVPYIFLIGYEDFVNEPIRAIPIFILFFAIVLNIIPTLLYVFSYIFNRNKEKARSLFNRSFNALFWFWFVLTLVLGVASVV